MKDDTFEDDVIAFLVESNGIEGMCDPITTDEVSEAVDFLMLDRLSTQDIEKHAASKGGKLREYEHMDVYVGSYCPPKGGPNIPRNLNLLIHAINENSLTPFEQHVEFENLHPFTDGNGRTGRLIWAWHMLHHGIHPGIDLMFLEAFYRQTLEASEWKGGVKN